MIVVKPLDNLFGLVSHELAIFIAQLFFHLLLVDGHLGAIYSLFKTISRFDTLALDLIFLLEALGFMNHLLDFVFGETSFIVGNDNITLLARGGFFSGNSQDAIGINVISNFDLGDSSWSGWETVQIELSKLMIVLG
mmetsp:Transcript_15900/g.17742  ORF Transcript_15900/g.17742 Transcript_15900/m.17742 type:complete len:137 (+) Transcript_15900:406-816(+)